MNFLHFGDGKHINLDNIGGIEQVINNNGDLHGVIVSWLGVGEEFTHSFFEAEKAERILRHIARHTIEN